MPLAFSFFSTKQPSEPSELESEVVEQTPAQDIGFDDSPLFPTQSKSPFPVRFMNQDVMPPPLPEALPAAPWGPIPTLILPPSESLVPAALPPLVLPEKRATPKGLAALVVNQSEHEAPPLNRRPPTFPISPVAGSFSQPAASLLDRETLPAVQQVPSPQADEPPPPGADILREELNQEIEQVKNDLFGAVMGVSALKDRLDGLESQISAIQAPMPIALPAEPASPAPQRAEIEAWISAWMEDHLPAAIERALTAAQERALGTMSSAAFFRTSTRLSDTDRQSFFSQPPVILASTPV